jgi:hypothetical protein
MDPTGTWRSIGWSWLAAIAMGATALAIAGADAGPAAAGEARPRALPSPWTPQTANGGSVVRARATATRAWRLRSGPAPARSRISALVQKAAVVVMSARVRVASAPLVRGRRAILSIGRARNARLQVGIARTATGERRWAAWRDGVRASGPVTISDVPVTRGRLQRLSVTAAAASVVVRVDGRVVFRGRRAAMLAVSRRHVTLGLEPGAGRGNLLVSALSVRIRRPEVPKEIRRVVPPTPAPAVVTPFAAPAPAARLSAEERPYDPGFAFNQPIPPGVGTDPRSDRIVAQLDANTAISKVGLSASGEVPPVYVARPTDPLLSVSVGGQQTRFRVPAGAVAGGGSDSPMVILDPSHPDFGAHTELRLWQASVSGSSLSASGAGLFHYNSDGAILNPNGSPSLSLPFRGAGTGSGMSILAGLIRPSEVRQGAIEHALRFAYSARDFTNRYRAPASKTDQPNGTTTRDPQSAMDMGMRLQLDPAVDCAARTVPGKSAASPETRYLRMVCVALQRYGMIAIDGTVDRGVLFQMESQETAPWSSIVGATSSGSYGYLLRDADSPGDGLARGDTSGIPWHRLRVLDRSVM